MKWDPNVIVRVEADRAPLRPFDHQVAAWDAMSRDFGGKHDAGLLVLPTGAGKTFVATRWLLQHHVRNGGRVLWLAHRKSLLRQAFRTFLSQANSAHPRERLGLIAISGQDASWRQITPDHDVVFSSIQTAGREDVFEFVDAFLHMKAGKVFVVVDEAHHASAASYFRLLKTMRERGCKLLGLTATPVRLDDQDEARLHAMFGRHIIHQVTRRTLVERGILAAPNFETVQTRVDFEREFNEDDYKHLERYGELAPNVLRRLASHAGRNALIVKTYKDSANKYGPTIVFAADTLHAQTLAKEFTKSGVSADYVDYSRDDAQSIIDSYQQQRGPQVLVNVEMLTEGFDAPHTRTVFIARPTRSEGLLAQMVGRALRGRESGGNEHAYLVTFLDTWKQFDVLDAEYVLRKDDPEEGEGAEITPSDIQRTTIPTELIHEAYRILQSVVRADIEGVFACLPHSWYAWEQTFDDDVRRRVVLVFEHQLEGFAAFEAAIEPQGLLKETIDEDRARALVQQFFRDIPDPLPRWADLQAFIEARQQGAEIHRYTFEEKRTFEPKMIAKKLIENSVPIAQVGTEVEKLWAANPACRIVYRNDAQAFQEEVMREITNILKPAKPPVDPKIEKIVPTDAPRAWGPTEAGYSLIKIRDAVVANKRNFPGGTPPHGSLVWSDRVSTRTWGFYRYSDQLISINCVLNSPDVPLFVLEFLMFHELLHGEMPHAGHNADFRARERQFTPSLEAVEDAQKRGITAGQAPAAWRALGDMYFDTFERKYLMKRPGSTQGMQL